MRSLGIAILASLTVTACSLPPFPPEGTGGTGAGGTSATGGSKTMGGTTSTGGATSGDAGSPTMDAFVPPTDAENASDAWITADVQNAIDASVIVVFLDASSGGTMTTGGTGAGASAAAGAPREVVALRSTADRRHQAVSGWPRLAGHRGTMTAARVCWSPEGRSIGATTAWTIRTRATQRR